jgi:hypothetical protein
MWGEPSVLVYRRFNAEYILDRRFNAEHIRRECLPNISTAELTPFICGIRQRNENVSNLFEIGGRDMTTASYDGGGVISPRPFRLRRLGHIGYDVDHLDDTLDFADSGVGGHEALGLALGFDGRRRGTRFRGWVKEAKRCL